MGLLEYVERKGTDCAKWDALEGMFGRDDLLPLWVADMDFKVPQCVRDALHEYVELGAVGYYKVPDAYYEAFIAWEREYFGYEVEQEWIRFSPGVVSAFNWGINMLTEEGDAVAVLAPVYYPFFNAIEHNNRKLVQSELINNNGEYTIDYADFEAKVISDNVKLLILSSPHNPVGRVWKKEELRRLFDICRKYHIFVLSDEIHQDFVMADNVQTPSLAAGEPGEYDDMMIMMTAPSKTFNLAGGQNSIIVIPDEKIREKWDIYTDKIRVASGNPFGYIAARAAYEGGREWLEELKELIYSNYLMLKEMLISEFPMITVSPLEGTYLMWIDLASYVYESEIETFIKDKCGLAVDFGNWFRGEGSGTFIRVNLATSSENVREAGSRIIAALK